MFIVRSLWFRIELNLNKQILYCSAKVCCKLQYSGLNVLNSSYRLVVTSDFSNTTVHYNLYLIKRTSPPSVYIITRNAAFLILKKYFLEFIF